MRLEMKTLTKIWKKLLNEAGIPVSDIIDELRKDLYPIWEEEKISPLRQFIRCPVVHFDAMALHIE